MACVVYGFGRSMTATADTLGERSNEGTRSAPTDRRPSTGIAPGPKISITPVTGFFFVTATSPPNSTR